MSRRGYVYFIQAGSGGPVKIGFSVNPESRIRTLQVAQSEPLTVLGCTPGEIGDELQYHDTWRTLRIGCEWFRPSPELLAFATKLKPLPSVEQRANDRRGYDDSAFRERLKRARHIRQMRQADVARGAGLSGGHYSGIENRTDRLPTPSTIQAIADALDVCPGWLTYGVGDEPKALINERAA